MNPIINIFNKKYKIIINKQINNKLKIIKYRSDNKLLIMMIYDDI